MKRNNRMFIIAEVGQAHDGSLGILHSYIDAVAKTGADAIKFQTHVAEAESSSDEPFRVRFSYEDETRQAYWRRMEFTSEQWVGIKQHCEDVGLEFLSTPSCLAAVDLLEQVGVTRYKIGSGDTENRLLLRRVAETGKQIILSTGVSTFEEVDETVHFLSEFGSPLVVMQCTSEYPVAMERVGLNLITEFRRRYSHPIGLSDHSGTIFPGIAAAALGVTYFEAHVVFDRRMFGPDSTSSITLDELKQLVEGVRAVERSMHSSFTKTRSPQHVHVRGIFGKSLAVNRNMKAGEVIAFADLESKKPVGKGVPAREYADVLGKRLRRDLAKWEFLSKEDLA
jgi:N,N'-diacetyllegionaminate synthase